MRQRRIDSFELISETRRIRIEICCRCPIHVQAAHALHLGMVKDLKCVPPKDPEKCPPPASPFLARVTPHLRPILQVQSSSKSRAPFRALLCAPLRASL
jgi:hypothetical protein